MGEKPNKNPQYFEAIIQLRNPNDEIVNFITNQVKKRKGAFIAKTLRVMNGVDFYISDQRFARALGNRMKKSFKGELKTSRKLFSRNRQTSKDEYRVTVCFRMLE